VSTSASPDDPTLPNTTAAFRFIPRSFARFIGEPLNAALNSGCVMPNSSRASVRASFVPNAGRGANGEPSGSSWANRWFHGQTLCHTSQP
jgi:hypothetical protein